MANITIRQLTGLALIQDFGRFNNQSKGISVNGAADEYAFMQANRVLNNALFTEDGQKANDSCAAIEVYYGQMILAVDTDCYIAITGADCHPVRINQKNQQEIIPMGQPYLLHPQDIVRLERPKLGVISYIAVKGGIQSSEFLKSRSQSVVGSRQLPQIKPLTEQQTLPFNAQNEQTLVNISQGKNNRQGDNFYQGPPLALRFIPHQNWFDAPKHQQQQWLATTFTVHSKSNRMAYQFSVENNSEHPMLNQLTQSLSAPVSFGTIQLLPSGSPIVLMKDRQTMGGYPTLGSVFQTDLFRLSQLSAGDKVTFIPAEIKQAQSQLSAFYQRFNQQ